MKPVKRNSSTNLIKAHPQPPKDVGRKTGYGAGKRFEPSKKEYNSFEDARIRALDNMKNHEALYMEYLENLSGKQHMKEDELRKEKSKIEELINKNSKVVLKLVSSYFEELKEQWIGNYHNVVQESVIGALAQQIKKARQKLSKIRKISESFVNGDFEEDLLQYALEKDISETSKQIEELTRELELHDKRASSSVPQRLTVGQYPAQKGQNTRLLCFTSRIGRVQL